MSSDDRRIDRFERELTLAARSLAAEPLPFDLLDAPAPATRGRSRSTALGGAILAVAAAIVVAVWVGGLLPRPGAGAPAFRPAEGIAAELRVQGYTCSMASKPSTRPDTTATAAATEVPPQLVCTTPRSLEPVVGALVLDLDPAGAIAAVHGKSGIMGPSTAPAESTRAALLATFIGIAFPDDADAAAARAWLADRLPLDPSATAETTIAGVGIVLTADTQRGYEMILRVPDPGTDTSP